MIQWNSPDGVRRVVGTMQHNGHTLNEVQTGDSRFCDLVSDDDLATMQHRDERNLISRAIVATVTPEPKPQTSLDRFLATMQPMKAGRARKCLERLTTVNGRYAASRAHHIDRLVSDGYRVTDDGRLAHADRPGYFTSESFTSYGLEYARWLTA